MQNLRRLSVGLLIALCLLAGSVMAEEPYRVFVDGVEMKFAEGLGPVEINHSVLLPMRDLFERLGANVVWDDASQKVFAVKDKLVMILPIDQEYAYFNGRSVRMAVPAKLIEARTYVPLRFVSTIFGAGVNYDAETKRIDISVTPGSLSGDALAMLEAVESAVAATRQISTYKGDLVGHYSITLGDATIPMAMQANIFAAGPTELAFDYTLSSTVKPEAIKGEAIVSGGKLYTKAPEQDWVVQTTAGLGEETALVTDMLAGLAGGDLSTLPLADMFGEVMLPKAESLTTMKEQGLIASLDDLGVREADGNVLNGYRLRLDPVRFTYFYSNLGGLNPKLQGLVLDNVQAINLSAEYWFSPDDQIIYESLIDLHLMMKSYPEAPEALRFDLTLQQRLIEVNQPVEIMTPVLD